MRSNRLIHIVSPELTMLSSSLFLFHIIRRLLECLFLDKHSDQAKMNLLHYAAAMYHYSGGTVGLIAHSVGIRGNSTNSIEFMKSFPLNWLQGIGIALFFYASWEQWKSHQILAKLRSKPGKLMLYLILMHVLQLFKAYAV